MTDSAQSSTPADNLNEDGKTAAIQNGAALLEAVEDAQRAADQIAITAAKAAQDATETVGQVQNEIAAAVAQNSYNFDVEQADQIAITAAKAAQDANEIVENVQSEIAAAVAQNGYNFDVEPAALLDTVLALQDALLIATQKLQLHFPPDRAKEIIKFFESRKAYIGDLTPYLEKELEQLHKDNPETAAITLEDIASSFDLAGCFSEADLNQLYAEFEKDPNILDGDPVLKYMGLVFGAVRRAKEKLAADHEKEKLETVAPPIPLFRNKLPKKHIMPIQRLANELQHGEIIGAGGIDLIVANRGKKNEITSFVLATYEQPDGVTMTGKPYTEYDRQVQDAVSSLWEFGDQSHVITPETVFRAMTHRTQTETPSPQQIGAVTKSLEKMRRIHITVDATEEMKKRKVTVDGKQVASCKFDDSLLSLRAVEVKTGGKTLKAYKITAEPVLLTYAKLTKQIATVPAERLDIKKVDKAGKVTTVSISNSDARIAVKGYILRRIEIMKRDKRNKNQKQSNKILFDSLFEETDTPKDSNSANIKQYVFQVLDYYTATGYIKGYTKRKKAGKGGGFDAVVIDL